MALIVQKYGGSSLATPELIKKIAGRIVERHDSGDRLVIVVSAMGKTTNALEAKALAVSDNPTPREMDMLISIGERESISLMAIAVNSMRPGLAVSFTGSQIGLITDNNHRNARILEIKGDRLVDALNGGKIPIIAGFQGVSTEKEITTLGRGGSDTTAVAVAAALGADMCEIYSDVVGVYSADPGICDDPVLIKELDYDTMLTISSLGAKVLKDSAVEYAKRLGVSITTGMSWTGETGTVISGKGSLNNDKFVSLVYNDKLSYSTFGSEEVLPEDISSLRFYQKCGGSALSVFDRSPLSGEEKCFSLAVTGSGIKSEPDKLRRMYELLSDPAPVLGFNLTDIKFEIFLKYPAETDRIRAVHSLFFDRN
ncbi:MAG: aspartate kinase [Candidatus Delongbacteria bacterium]|nr:aspartate kinase [Candidatus Delongbacteria bacterium]